MANCSLDPIATSSGAGRAHDHTHAHSEDGEHPEAACEAHLEQAFERYSASLQAAKNICRAARGLGLAISCCDTQPVPVAIKNGSDQIAQARPVQGAQTTARPSSSHGHHHHHGMKRRTKKPRHVEDNNAHGHTHTHDEHDCCSGQSHDDRHSRGQSHAQDGQSCCSGHSHGDQGQKDGLQTQVVSQSDMDIERGNGLERVALTVDGMDCSGCGNKLERTLRDLPGVSSVRVNFVMRHAEFTLAVSITSAEHVAKAVERATGFKCTILASDDQTLDIIASRIAAKSILNLAIPGVTQITSVDNKVVRLSYDPAMIGARTLLGMLGDHSRGLAPPRADPSVASGRKRMYDQLFKTVAAAILTTPVVVFAWGENLIDKKTRAIVSIILATFVQLIAVPDFYRPALGALIRKGDVEMDMLVVISITAAYVYSLVAFGFRMNNKPLEVSEFFETSTLLITLVLLGRLITVIARNRAVSAVSMRSLQTATAVIVINGRDEEIDARLLQYGDQIKIPPHTAIPTDGVVISGTSDVDESMLTGESMPVSKGCGDAMIAGTMNCNGTIVANLTRLPGKNTVTDIATMVEEASNERPPIQDVADKVAGYFVPVVSIVAVIVVVVWIVVGLKVRKYGTGKAITNALTYAVATLAVSCPCALGLAVPMVLVVAGGIAARNGVIIKSTEVTERARKVTDVIFDKTGTITEDSLDVVEAIFLQEDRSEAVGISKALVAGNKHPVSIAVAKYLEKHAGLTVNVENIHVVPGHGVEASYKDGHLRAGNPQWTNTEGHVEVARLRSCQRTLLVISRGSIPIVVYGLSTRLRFEAKDVVSELIRRGIAVHMVSGDQAEAVKKVADDVGIVNVKARCTPPQKSDYVKGLKSSGKVTMFVGDGTNDAVAVAVADVGVQLGSAVSASEVTRGASHVVLLAGLEGVLFLFDISKVSFRRMVFNFAWSAVYNVLAILLASGAMVKVRIPPAYAGLGEIVSVVPVIAAAVTMHFTKIRTKD